MLLLSSRHPSVSRENGGDTSLGKNYGEPGSPNSQNPSLGFTNEIQRNASNTIDISSAAGAAVDTGDGVV